MSYISFDVLMKEFSDFVKRSNNSDYADTPTWNDAVSLVGSCPTADVVEVVRCRECKEWVPGQIEATDNFIPPRCVWLNKPMNADDYCSYGERSTDGDKKGL